MEPQEAYERLVKLGSEWAELNSAAEILENTKHSVRSQLALEYLPAAKSMAQAEAMAEASSKYTEHVTEMCMARKRSNIARVNFDAYKSYLEMTRTKEASRRAEITQFRG